MNRKLTKQEKEMCKIGINNRKKRIAELTKEIAYFEDFNKFNEKWAKYLEDKETDKKTRKKVIMETTLKNLKEDIENEQNILLIEQDQLKNGVEIKKMTGVN